MATRPQYGQKRPLNYKTAALVRDSLAALSHIERAVLSICEQAANAGRPLESNDDIMEALTSCGFYLSAYGGGTIPGIMERLQRKGFIERIKYQRGRQVCITATGKCTAPPACTAPHWRLRPKNDPIPTPAIHKVRERAPMAQQIELEARRLGKSMSDFLADLVYIGFHAYQAEQE